MILGLLSSLSSCNQAAALQGEVRAYGQSRGASAKLLGSPTQESDGEDIEEGRIG